jgi:hypothetical protein
LEGSMQHPIRFVLALSGLALAGACADSPIAPAMASESPPYNERVISSTTTTGPEYDWMFDKQLFAIYFGEHMDREPRTDETVIVPGDVKWIEYRLTATRFLPATYAGATLVAKDASARIDEQILQACKNVFPSIICTFGGDQSPAFYPFTIDGSTVRDVIVDMHNFYVCDENFSIVNRATLTELGPYPAGTSPQVHPASAKFVVKTGPCPPKPKNPGCTYTQGYWKNHAWPVHPLFPPSTLETWEADNGWSDLEWQFFDTKTDWIAILSVQPRGDAYYILAHQYIAAFLNQKNQAWVPTEVRETLYKSYAYFS